MPEGSEKGCMDYACIGFCVTVGVIIALWVLSNF